MTNKTVLSDARIELLAKQYDCDFMGFKGFALAVINEALQSPEIQQIKRRELQLAACVMVLAATTESMAENLGIDLSEAKATLEINGKDLSSVSLRSVIDKGRAAIAAMEVKP